MLHGFWTYHLPNRPHLRIYSDSFSRISRVIRVLDCLIYNCPLPSEGKSFLTNYRTTLSLSAIIKTGAFRAMKKSMLFLSLSSLRSFASFQSPSHYFLFSKSDQHDTACSRFLIPSYVDYILIVTKLLPSVVVFHILQSGLL